MNTSQAVERRPGQMLEGHYLAEDSAIHADLETGMLRHSPTNGTLQLPNDEDT